MSEMIERVARALEADYIRTSGVRLDMNPSWAPFRQSARAAIEAMREPTDKMLTAGGSVDAGHAWSPKKELVASPGSVWTAMIDEALKSD